MASSYTILIFLLLLQFSDHLTSHAALLLPLSHSISTAKFNTTHNLLKSTTTRSAARFHRYTRRVSLPLSPGTDYTLSFSIGSQTISLYMDTGSDVVWIPCHPFRCILCDGKYSPAAVSHPGPLNLTFSDVSRTPCKSAACSAVHPSTSSSDLCAIAKCPIEAIEMGECEKFACPNFYYAYGDGSLVAKLYQDTLNIPMSAPGLKLHNFTFGCAHSALGEPIGVAGFGRGVLSLPAQVAQLSPDIGNYFSYCLISHSFDETRVRQPSPLILGRYQGKQKDEFRANEEEIVLYKYTPLLENPKHSYFYCVGLEAMSVGNRKIKAPVSLQRIDRKGNGGMVVDSGTTYTMLPTKFYESILGEFNRQIGTYYGRATAVEERTGLRPCYYTQEEKPWQRLPKLALHFGGNSTVVMPRRNYFHDFYDSDAGKRVGCVMLMDGGAAGDEEGGPAGLFGNYQQQGFEVVYDLEQKRVGFARRKCASLWKTIS